MFDLARLVSERSGVQWGFESEDLDCTLLAWREGEGVPEHVNREVDVLVVVLAGEGELVLNGVASRLREGQAAMLPKGASRSLNAVSERFTHLNVHKRRRKLGLGDIGDYRRA